VEFGWKEVQLAASFTSIIYGWILGSDLSIRALKTLRMTLDSFFLYFEKTLRQLDF
jgi:hypothetical protein